MNQNRLDEITQKLSRLKMGGGVTRPLVPIENGATAMGFNPAELLELMRDIKAEFNLFRRETAVTLKEIKLQLENLSAVSNKKVGMIAEKSEIKDFKNQTVDEESYDDILDSLSALKEQIKSALDFDKD